MSPRIHRALISVSNKTGVVELAQALTSLNIEIISTGGTAHLLREHKINVTDISDYTGFPEMMGGRLKTLHPKVHGALLGRIGVDSEVMTKHGIIPIDLLVVNLYPFLEAINKHKNDLDHAIEHIDIGGPAMLRSAAKNYKRVTVVCDHHDYKNIIDELKNNEGSTTEKTRYQLACKAFTLIAQFDTMVANFLNSLDVDNNTTEFPNLLTIQMQKLFDLRYGENPHQKAAFYKETEMHEANIATAKLLQGKPMSYNNIADANAALECVRNFTSENACVIVKHENPCGVAIAPNQLDAYLRAYESDSTSAFGGVIAFNQPLETATAQKIIDNQFVEIIIAPAVEINVTQILSSKPNIRLLTCGELSKNTNTHLDYKKVEGGLLVQEADESLYQESDFKVVTKIQPTRAQIADLKFSMLVAKYVKSNAIVFVKDQQTIGVGAGQMSRVDSANIAVIKANAAKFSLKGAVMASDAFFPFRDVIDIAAKAGVTAIIQPGGSIRDDEIISAADELGIAMVFTGQRHFRH